MPATSSDGNNEWDRRRVGGGEQVEGVDAREVGLEPDQRLRQDLTLELREDRPLVAEADSLVDDQLAGLARSRAVYCLLIPVQASTDQWSPAPDKL